MCNIFTLKQTKMQIDTKHTNKWINIPCSSVEKFIIANMSNSHQIKSIDQNT